jgi:hypothetical protein
MGRYIFDHDVECDYCKGTGLYKGMAEKGGAAVVCYQCEGTGERHIHIEYNKFKGRKIRTDVKRVYTTAAGYIITDENVVIPEEHTILRFSKAGIKYREWLDGGEPEPIKDLHCPLQHYGQGNEIGENLKQYGPCNDYCNFDIAKCSREHREECWKEIE